MSVAFAVSYCAAGGLAGAIAYALAGRGTAGIAAVSAVVVAAIAAYLPVERALLAALHTSRNHR